jgi:hypothetical protein
MRLQAVGHLPMSSFYSLSHPPLSHTTSPVVNRTIGESALARFTCLFFYLRVWSTKTKFRRFPSDVLTAEHGTTTNHATPTTPSPSLFLWHPN